MSGIPTELETANAVTEAAWQAYDHAQRNPPECEHVKAWHAEIKRTRKAHRDALRAADKIAAEIARRRSGA